MNTYMARGVGKRVVHLVEFEAGAFRILDEGLNRHLMGNKQPGNEFGGGVAALQPDDLGWEAVDRLRS